MNEITRAALILNAVGIPLKIFEKLCRDYAPEEIYKGEIFWNELGLKYSQQKI